jgi:hypothetical protein
MKRFVLVTLVALCASCGGSPQDNPDTLVSYTLRPLLEAMPADEAERFRSMLANP